MKKRFTYLIKVIPLLAFVLAFTLTKAQINYAPLAVEDFSLTVNNMTQTANNKIEFDVYLLDTDPAQDMELASIQFGWLFNSGIYTGGTVSAVINNTGSGLIVPQQFTAAPSIVASVAGYPGQTLLRLAGKVPPGAGNGTIISKVAPGTFLTHFTLTSTVPWTTSSTPNFVWNSSTALTPLYATRVATYIGVINTQLVVTPGGNATICCNPILNPPGPPTAYNVTGGGSYCEGLTGLPVGLDNSELGVTYTLYKGAVAQVPTKPGTGAAITFGNQLAGTYTVKGTNGTGTTDMTGSAIISETPSLPVSVTIAPDANNICQGTSVIFTATPVNGGLPAYQWFLNNVATVTTPTYTLTPANNDQVKVVITSNLGGCLSGNPATSNIVTMLVSPAGPASVSIVPSANPSCGAASVTFTATPVNGGAATYEWFVNTISVGNNSPIYTYTPLNNDNVYVVMTSSLPCATASPATSNTITMAVTTPLPASVSIAASANPICQYNAVTFTATPINGGTPTYQWYLNSVPTGSGLATYTNFDPGNNDQVYVVMTSSLCSTGSPATSATTTMVVHPAPAPTISGPANVCVNVAGNVYTTEPGMSQYTWTHGTGIVTAGGTVNDNTITITWPSTGLQTLSVNYSNANLCRASNPSLYSPTVYALPVPTITGPITPVGVGTTQVYTTEAGMTGYSWSVSAGGFISAGGTNTSNTISILWNTAGPQTVSVNYINANGCTATASFVFNVTVVSIPPPAGIITGTATVCQGSNAVAYSVAPIPNATGYVWTLPTGATIATGPNTNSITVNFSFTAVSGNITVYGTNTFGNGAPSPNFAVTVNPAATPTITGPATPCIGTSVVYTTQTGMTGYIWTVSAGGLITAGGTSSSNTVTVLWNVIGPQTVSVNYANANGCTAATPFVFNVTVAGASTPTLTGPTETCSDAGTVIYYTQSGQTNYQWTVSPGGTVIAGGTSMTWSVTVQWNTIGAQFVSVNYNNAGGCAATSPFVYNVNVSKTPDAAGSISGPAVVCAGATEIGYSVNAIANATSYVWTIPSGATITAGDGTNAITVDFSPTATSGNIVVHGTNYCGDGATATKAVTVDPLPVSAGAISGLTTVCQGQLGVVYTIEPIANATSYVWTIPVGANLIYGDGTDSIVVDYSRIAENGAVTVYGVNDCGIGSGTSVGITVKLIPETPVITIDGTTLTSSAPEGNQWYLEGAMIEGATAQTYEVLASGNYTCIVTLDGCPSEPSNTILFTGVSVSSKGKFEIFPIPSNGVFTATMVWPSSELFSIRVYNSIGSLVFEKKDILVNGITKQTVDLRPMPSGMYTVTFTTGSNNIIRKVMISRD